MIYLETVEGSAATYLYLWASWPARRQVRLLESLSREPLGRGADNVGWHVIAAAGAGSMLLYGLVDVGATRCGGPEDFVVCSHFAPRQGWTGRVARRQGVRWGGPPPALLAVAGDRWVVVPADRAEREDGIPRPEFGGTVQIRRVGHGVTASFAPAGVVQAVALSSRVVAVLVDDGNQRRVERYSIQGQLLGSTAVPDAASDLVMEGDSIVYRAGVRIRHLSAATGTDLPLATAARMPVGLSIDRSRVAWAENFVVGRERGSGRLKYRSRVRVVTFAAP